MSHLKKRPGHRCAAHPNALAIARCSVCKTWVCRTCGAKIDHQWFCPSCAAKKPAAADQDPLSTAPAPKQAFPWLAMTMHSLVLLAAITLGLCGLAFGLWNMRTASDLSAQNGVLRVKRTELLDQIRQRNQEIAMLTSRFDSVRVTQEVALPVNRYVGHQDAAFEGRAPTGVAGLPVSFDNGAVEKKLVALTFDGGGQASAAFDILDTLASRNVKATMFLTGQFMQRKADVVRRIISAGHEIGNHTYSHPHLTSFVQDHTQSTLSSVNESFLARELTRTDSIFQALFGARLSPLWRAPYGDRNGTICAWAQRAGFLHIGWGQGRTWRKNLDSNDWMPSEATAGYHTPQDVFDKIIGLAKESPSGINGGIILMHLDTVRPQREQQVHLILGRLIDTLGTLGYRFVTVSELLRESGVDIGLLTHK